MSEHTAEPLVHKYDSSTHRIEINDSTGWPVAFIHVPPATEYERCEANTHRIVASVNFTAGVPTEALEGVTLKELVKVLKYGRKVLGANTSQSLGTDIFLDEAAALLSKLGESNG